MISRRLALALSLAIGAFRPAVAESYPARPIRFVVPFPAGGSTDVGARMIADFLSRSLHQQVFVENRSGANGALGVEVVAKSPPDGYTILITADAVVSNRFVFNATIDPTKDLVPIIQLSRQPIVLAAHPSLGVGTLAELIALAKRQPGLRYGTGSGVGSTQHMAIQWFAKLAGISLEQVPYRGGGQAITDLLGGHVQLGSLGSTPLIPHYKSGALRLLAQTTAKRSPSLPDVPTFDEAGAKGLVIDQWLGAFAPVGTPPDIVALLNSEIGKALADPVVRKPLVDGAQEPVGGTAAQFTAFVRENSEMFSRLVKDLNIKVD
jgi:tripartite-type tricarboxylate transporter receptor subunit TctC